MVNLAKIRKKAKESREKASKGSAAVSAAGPPASGRPSESMVAAGETPANQPAGGRRSSATGAAEADGATPATTAQISKLERFKQEAGKRRKVKRAAVDTTAAEQVEALRFILSGEHYAVEIEKIVEIVTPRPLTRVPNAGELIVGIISLRGAVVTLLDLRRRLNHPPAVGESEERRIVVVEHEGETLGFEVDRVLRVVSVPRAEIEPQPVAHAIEQDESVQGVFRVSSSLTILLDLDKLLTASMLPAS